MNIFNFNIMDIINSLISLSSDICLISGVIGAVLFIFGAKRCRNIPYIAFALDLIIRTVGGLLLNG